MSRIMHPNARGDGRREEEPIVRINFKSSYMGTVF